MADTPLIFPNALAHDKNIQSVLRAIEVKIPASPRTCPPQKSSRSRIISLTDSEGEPAPNKHSSPPNPKRGKKHVPSSPRVFVIEDTVETDEEYQEYLVDQASKQAAHEAKKAAKRGRSAERHARLARERERSAELHKRLAKKAGKLPEERNASSKSYVDTEFDAMLANLTFDEAGGESFFKPVINLLTTY